jgi:hypothetical protein
MKKETCLTEMKSLSTQGVVYFVKRLHTRAKLRDAHRIEGSVAGIHRSVQIGGQWIQIQQTGDHFAA